MSEHDPTAADGGATPARPGGSGGPPDTRRTAVLTKPDDTGTEAGPAGAPSAYRPPHGPARRFWSRRRVPAVVVALLVLAGSGLLLYDLVAVRTGHPAMQWRRTLADELATRPLNDAAVLAGAAVAALLGLWLLLLAVTPGLRGLLPMRRSHPDVRAGLQRRAAGLVLRDRAVQVPGVQTAGVHAGRRRVRVRALVHFRDLDDVRADLHAALSEGVRDLGLARPPALTVRVVRAGRKG